VIASGCTTRTPIGTLAGLKPDITGTATTTASELDLFPPQVELIIKMKSGSVNLDTESY
jgi:hypothetical protein